MKTEWCVGRVIDGSNFDYFAKDFFSDVYAMLRKSAPEWKVVKKNKGYFFLSMFLQNEVTGEYRYLSTGDVRYFKDEWYNKLLARTANSAEDYTGGANHFIKFYELPEFLKLHLTS